MKKVVKLLFVLILAAVMVFFSVRHIGRRYVTSGKYEYKINIDKTITLVKYTKLLESEAIVIPFTIDGYTVTVVDSNAVDCINSEEIIIADTVTSVKKNAFINCEQVNILTVPSHLVSLEGFSNLINVNLLTITYGQNGFMPDFTSIEERIWNGSSNSLKKLVISDGIKYLSDNAFRDLTGLEIIKFPDTVESIGEYCFYNNYNLKSVDLPGSIKSIKNHAFDTEENRELTAVILIPQTVTYLGEDCLSKDRSYVVYEDSEAVKYARNNNLNFTLIDLNFTEVNNIIKVGDTVQLNVVDSNILSDEIRYVSSDPKVATVTDDGLIYANSIGAVKITVKTDSGENSLMMDVIVNDENASEIKYLLLDLGEKVTLNASNHDCFIGLAEGFTYTSSDEKIAQVDESGNISILKGGSVKVTISNSGTNVVYYLSIAKLVKDIKIEHTVINLKKGNTFNINATAVPFDAKNKSLTYYSSDPGIAKVTSDGKIIATRNGTAIITVKTNDGSEISKKIAVNVSRTKVSCYFYRLGLMVNKQFRLRCSVNDNSTLVYSSSDEKIATVDISGVIHPKKSGECYITVSNENFTSSITVPIRVYDAFSYGLDLSQWNGRYMTDYNFRLMKKDGVDFVILRAAYDNDWKDPVFERNYEAAKKAGLDVGAYHYIESTTVEDAIIEAKWMLKCIEGKKFEYPIFLDIESKSHKYLDSYTFNALVNAYCDVLKEAGYYPGVYSYSSMMKKYNFKYDVWIAHWDTTHPNVYNDNFTIWQFTSKAKVKGVQSTNVDVNICFIDYPSIMKEQHVNGY